MTKNRLILEPHEAFDGITCGEWVTGQARYCTHCEAVLLKTYPQGWQSYAGDVCKHGTYIGGCGIDWMCGRCENE